MRTQARPVSLIIPQPIARSLALVPGYEGLLESLDRTGGASRQYPDGSLQFDRVAKEAFDEFLRIKAAAGFPGPLPQDSAAYGIPVPPPPQRYVLVVGHDYQASLDGNRFVINYFDPAPAEPTGRPPEDLHVSVQFGRRMAGATMQRFSAALAGWADAVAVRGIFEEGPAALAGPEVLFNGLTARFRVDLSRSGQATLNWLILMILDFGRNVAPASSIALGDRYALDQADGSPHGRSVSVTISPAPAPPPDVPNTYVPPEAVPDPTYPSTRLRILRMPDFEWEYEWDSFKFRVFFGALPAPDVQAEFRRLIEAWLTIGYYGGLGGTGIHHDDGLQFDEQSESAGISADMIGSEPDVAIPLLIRLLEQFESRTVVIDALVFGSWLLLWCIRQKD